MCFGVTLFTLNWNRGAVTLRNELYECMGAKGFDFLSYFFVKKISLSRRDEYVVDGSMDQ